MIISYQAERNGRARAAVAVGLYGVFLFLTNPLVTVFGDEASLAGAARKTTKELVVPFLSGRGAYHHPPLADVVLHFWLRWTGESPVWLRLPSIVLYSLALWMVAETAQLLWGRRWTAVALGVAWPAGYFLGRPAGWYALSMLEEAAVAWCYLLWRHSGQRRPLAGLALWGVLLVYTNYFGWVFPGILAVDLWLSRPERQRIVELLGALGVVGLAFVPLVPELVQKLGSEVATPAAVAPRFWPAPYLIHSLLASEMAAPWTWPGAIAAACGAGLLGIALGQRESHRPLWWLAAPLAIGLALGVVSGVRLALFGPWLLLLLTSVVGGPRGRIAAALAGVAFAMGWIGVATGRYAGTHRYIEPWREAAPGAVALSQPGDVIICNHPSFYFYTSYLLPWAGERGMPPGPVAAAGRTFTPLSGWRQATAGSFGHVIYVRTVLMSWAIPAENEFLEYAARHLRLLEELRFDPDRSAALKRRWFPNVPQPEWRIRIQVWTKRQ